jgi:hypothetical protein
VADKPLERVLYITIFDHKERTNTRVYTHNEGDRFYSMGEGVGDDTLAGKENVAGKRRELDILEESQQQSCQKLESNLQSESGDVTMRIVEHLQNVGGAACERSGVLGGRAFEPRADTC